MDPNRRHPSKEEVRAWMDSRRVSCRAGLPLPLPSPDEIRRQLGWHQASAAPVEASVLTLPILLAELATLTVFTWCWLVLQSPCERRRPIS